MTDSTKEERGSAVTIEIRLLGLFEVRRSGRARSQIRGRPCRTGGGARLDQLRAGGGR